MDSVKNYRALMLSMRNLVRTLWCTVLVGTVGKVAVWISIFSERPCVSIIVYGARQVPRRSTQRQDPRPLNAYTFPNVSFESTQKCPQLRSRILCHKKLIIV